MEPAQLLGGRYRLEERIGRGGTSLVWRARDEVLHRPVAVKVLQAPLEADALARSQIQAEARSAARLSHPHLTSVHDYGECADDDGDCQPFVVMELLTGPTLAQRVAEGPLAPAVGLRVCAEVASGLAAAHDEGLVHRDVKPGNVVLTPSGAKVLDFGIAASVGPPPRDTGTDSLIIGTPQYLAPERWANGDVVPASDVYALGVLLYRVLTGGLPWDAETVAQLCIAHTQLEPATLPPIDGVPAEVVRLCRRCLAKDPADRPTAREAADILADAAGITLRGPDEPAPARPSAVPRPRTAVESGPGRRLRAAGTAAALVNAAAAGRAAAAATVAPTVTGTGPTGNAGTAPDAVPGADTGTTTNTDAPTGTDPAIDTDADTDTDTGAGTDADTGAGTDTTTDAASTATGASTDARASTDAGAAADPGAAAVTAGASVTDAGTAAGVRTGARPAGRRRRGAILVAGGAVALLLATLLLQPDERPQALPPAPEPSAGVTATVSPGPAVRTGQPALEAGRPSGAPATRAPVGPVATTGAGAGGGPAGQAAQPLPTVARPKPTSDAGPVIGVPPAVDPPAAQPSPTEAPPPERSLAAVGGTVVAVCVAGLAQLVTTDPASGFTLRRADPGPARRLVVTFAGDDGLSRMVVRCVDGVPTYTNEAVE